MASRDTEVVRHADASPETAERACGRPTFAPLVDIYQMPTGTVLLADMPGVDEKSVDVRLEEGVLTLTGHVPDDPVAGRELAYAEYCGGEYRRVFSLADTVDHGKVDAELRNGVLRVHLPMAASEQPRKIEVKAG